MVSIYRLSETTMSWEFSLNLILGFTVECLSFGLHKYLAVAGNQLTIWEEVTLSSGNDHDEFINNQNPARAWFNVFSTVMPRAFKYIEFSPCETLFVSSESHVIIYQQCIFIYFKFNIFRVFH